MTVDRHLGMTIGYVADVACPGRWYVRLRTGIFATVEEARVYAEHFRATEGFDCFIARADGFVDWFRDRRCAANSSLLMMRSTIESPTSTATARFAHTPIIGSP